MSNYNYGLEPGIEGTGSSGLRFVLIFLVISAVTAALLWWFWPEKDGDKAEKNKKIADVEQVGTPKQTAPAEIGPADLSVKKTEKTSGSADGVRKAPLSGEGASPVLPVEKKQAPPAADPTDPPLPAKGILTPADRKGADLPVVPADNVISDAQKKQLEQASLLLNSKKYEDAEKLALSSLENVAENSAFYRKAWKVLTQIRMRTVFYSKKAPYLLRYRIRSGDTLGGIANRFFTTVELLRKRNNISGSRIFVGRVLYIVPGDWKITVSKKFRLLKLYRKDQKGEKLFALWEIGIGRMGKTPAAEFAIAARVRHPDWYLPDGRVFKYGTPDNQLGDYFLKLAPSTSPGRPLLGYGIHGASDESTVGRSLSSGCIRMRNADVELLYYLVPTGCRVSIMEE